MVILGYILCGYEIDSRIEGRCCTCAGHIACYGIGPVDVSRVKVVPLIVSGSITSLKVTLMSVSLFNQWHYQQAYGTHFWFVMSQIHLL